MTDAGRKDRGGSGAPNAALVVCALLASLGGLGVLGVLGEGAAHAGGMEFGDNGAEALARGGAFVAKADNPTAVNYNPAGFVKLRGHHAAISASILYSDYTFQRSGYMPGGNASSYPTIRNQKPWFVAPMHLMVTTDFGIFDRVTFGAGLYVPAASSRAYPAEITLGGAKTPSPARFDFLSMDGLMFFPTAAMAIRVTDWLDIGITFQAVVTMVKLQMLATVASACETPEDPQCDVTIELDGKDMFSPSGSVGVMLRPSKSFEIGGLLRLPSKSTLNGTAKVKFGPAISRLESKLQYKMLDPAQPQVELTNAYPLMMRLGGRYIFRDKRGDEAGDIEVDLVYERWSMASLNTVQIKGRSLGKPMPEQVVDQRLKDTFSLRVGAAYRFRLANDVFLALRGGVFAETATTAISDTRLQTVGAARIAFTGGLGLQWGRLRFDVAVAHFLFPKRVVGQSTLAAQDFGGGAGPVVGNGTYTAKATALALQVGFAFGARAKAKLPSRRPPRHDDYDGMGLYLSKRRRRGKGRRRFASANERRGAALFGGTASYATRKTAGSAARAGELRRTGRRRARGDGLSFEPQMVRRSAKRAAAPRANELTFEPATVTRSNRSRRRVRRSRRYRSRRYRARRRYRSRRYRARRHRARRYRRSRRARVVRGSGLRRVRTTQRRVKRRRRRCVRWGSRRCLRWARR